MVFSGLRFNVSMIHILILIHINICWPFCTFLMIWMVFWTISWIIIIIIFFIQNISNISERNSFSVCALWIHLKNITIIFKILNNDRIIFIFMKIVKINVKNVWWFGLLYLYFEIFAFVLNFVLFLWLYL